PPAFIATLPSDDSLFVAESNPALQDLEDADLLHQRGLIQVSVDGFTSFRAPPSLLNLAFTAPYGVNGSINAPILSAFISDSVLQHFPRTLARNPGVDFRFPTQVELDALVAFLQSLRLPPDGDFTLDRLVRSAAQQRGSDLFFGTARCAQ